MRFIPFFELFYLDDKRERTILYDNHSLKGDHSDYRSINSDFILISIFSSRYSVAVW